MAEEFSIEKAQEAIEGGIAQAQELMNDPAKVDDLLQQIQQQIANLPETVTGALGNIPLMASMVKSYVTKEYTEVSPKVVASVVAAFLYLVKQKDLIPDNVPVVGLVDDLAVVTAALKLNEPELEAFKAWKATQPTNLPATEI